MPIQFSFRNYQLACSVIRYSTIENGEVLSIVLQFIIIKHENDRNRKMRAKESFYSLRRRPIGKKQVCRQNVLAISDD